MANTGQDIINFAMGRSQDPNYDDIQSGMGGSQPGGPVVITLGTLSLSTAITSGTVTNGSINGATSGSAIASNVMGLTVNSGARTFAFDGSATTGTTANGLVETLAGAVGSPKSSPVTVAAAGGGTDTDPAALSTANAGKSLSLFAVPGYANVGQPYAMLPAVKGGSAVSGATKSFSLSGTLPPGASFNTSTGEITASSLTTSGSYSGLQITCTVIPTNETAQTQVFTIPVGAAAVTISPSGDTTGATDTVAINAALAAGNSVKMANGSWYTNAPITQSSNTAIYLPTGTVLLAANSNCQMWRNANIGSRTRTDQNMAMVGPGSGSCFLNGNAANQVRQTNQRINQGVVAISAQNVMHKGFRVSAQASAVHYLGCRLMQLRDWYPDHQVNTANNDGLDLGSGTSFVHVESVQGGRAYDDVFSFYGKLGQSSTAMMGGTPWADGADCTDIIINDVLCFTGLANMFRLQAGDGFKFQRMFAKNINNTQVNGSGDMRLIQFGELSFAVTPPAAADMSHIYVDGGGAQFNRLIAADSNFSNVAVRGLVLTRSLTAGLTVTAGSNTSYNNVTIEDITESGTPRNHGSLYLSSKTTGTVSNIAFNRWSLLSVNTLLSSTLAISNISYDTITLTQNSTTTSAPPAVTSNPASTGTLTNVTVAGTPVDPGASGLTYTGGAGTPTISFANPTASVAEGNSGTTTVTNTVNVVRNGVTGDLVVNLAYSGTATSGTDYATPPTTATILAGQNSVSFNTVINGDTTVEGDETIIITATLAAYTSSTATKTITITNEDASGTAPTFSDTFTGTDGTALTAHTPDIGSGWTLTSGGFVITTNQARPGARTSEVQTVQSFTTPIDAAYDLSYATLIANTTQYIKVLIDANNYYLFGYNGSVLQIRKVVGGAASAPIGTNTGAVPSASAANLLRAELRPGSQNLYLNNTLIASATDTLLDGATVKVGLLAAGSGAAASPTTGERFDNVTVTPR